MMLIIKDCRVLDLEKPATRIQFRNAPARRRFMAAYRTAAAVLAALACLIPPHTPLSAQTNVQSGANDALDRLQWRELGPAVMGGRIDDFAVVEKNPDVIYAATATKSRAGSRTVTTRFARRPRICSSHVLRIGS
jgi:hypothetical protein